MQNLLFGFKHIRPEQRQFELDYIVELLKLEHLTERMPIKLSGGEKQRVALGRALLYSPQLLLLDEPLSAFDSAQKEIIPFFQKIKAEIKIPMLYVSHDKSEIEQLTHEIWYL
jgi:molybdate transport system ATP-binding protein